MTRPDMADQDHADAVFVATDALNAAIAAAVKGGMVVKVDYRTAEWWGADSGYSNEITRVEVRVQRDLDRRREGTP